MDPILGYLIEFNKINSIEYKGRYLIPPGGLQKMLDDFQGFRLNREEIIKPSTEPAAEPRPEEKSLDELYDLLD